MPVNADNTGPRPHWAAAFFAVRREMHQWITDALHRHASIPYSGGHDEGSFIASWLTDHLLFGDERVLDFARFLRDGFAEWSREHQLHGFYRTGEAHHQTEIYNCFLARLWAVAPDELTAELLVDAAHHVGNWVEGFPPWYDWDEHRFLSWRIGTETVGTGVHAGYEVPDHFRLIQLALVAYRITGEQRYLDLSCGYADRWSREILSAPPDRPPIVSISGETSATDQEMRRAAGIAHNREGGLDLVEPHVAAGTIDVLLDLYETTTEQRYARVPLACGALRFFAQERSPVRYRASADEPGLPEQVASLVRTSSNAVPSVMLYNDSDAAVTVEVSLRDGPWQAVALEPCAVTHVIPGDLI